MFYSIESNDFCTKKDVLIEEIFRIVCFRSIYLSFEIRMYLIQINIYIQIKPNNNKKDIDKNKIFMSHQKIEITFIINIQSYLKNINECELF